MRPLNTPQILSFKESDNKRSQSISNECYFIMLLVTLILPILTLSISHVSKVFFNTSYSSLEFVQFILSSSLHVFRNILFL